MPNSPSRARAQLDASGHGGNVRIENADALHYATDRRFDAICVTAAVDAVPSRFLQWLRPGGRLFVVRGRSPVMEAVLVAQRRQRTAHRIVVRNRPPLSRRRRAGAGIRLFELTL